MYHFNEKMQQELHMNMNAANERRNSRAQFLQQQQQLKQQNICIPVGRNPSIPLNCYHAPSIVSTQNQLLPKELRGGESFAKPTTPILFLTNNQGLHLRTLNKLIANQNEGQERNFNVRCCDLERWNYRRPAVINTKEGLQNNINIQESTEGPKTNAHNLFEIQRIKTNFSRNHHYHHNSNNNDDNNYNNGLQRKTCVIL